MFFRLFAIGFSFWWNKDFQIQYQRKKA